MCGIAGFATTTPGHGDANVLERMTDAIRHRGPDDSGFYRDERVGLGHRRLSIVDLALGHQPIANEDRNSWIVFNGEIFNHADVRADLERAGHRYTTRSDTETILHAYEEYGSECVTRLRGMFAFAIWDRAAKTLFCARDRLGKKPFYYFWDGRNFVFASEIKALFEHPAVSPDFDESFLPEYLAFGYTSGDETLFRGVRKLMPGHHLTLRVADPAPAPTIRQYWNIPESSQAEDRPDESWIAEFRQRLKTAVETRLMSDVPLGMFLSGGVDSSAIAALMKRAASGPVQTFSVGYGEAAYSELDDARGVARTIGADHHEIVIGSAEFFDALPSLIWHEDEPIAWPSSVSLYFVSRLASERVKVVLTGEGSDELFGGYNRYPYYLLNRRMLGYYRAAPRFARERLRRFVNHSRLLSDNVRRKLGHTFLGRGEEFASLYLDNFFAAFTAEEQAGMLKRPGRSAYDGFLEHWNSRAAEPLLQRLLYTDQKTYMVELLMKQDQMSMAASIESRVPFLDHPLVEFAARVPERLKVRGGVGKYIVKKAAEEWVPRDILYRPKKGFPTPIRQWLRGATADARIASLLERRGFLADYLDLGKVESLLDAHRRGLVDATDRIWRLLNLQLWGDLYFSGRPRVAAPPVLSGRG